MTPAIVVILIENFRALAINGLQMSDALMVLLFSMYSCFLSERQIRRNGITLPDFFRDSVRLEGSK